MDNSSNETDLKEIVVPSTSSDNDFKPSSMKISKNVIIIILASLLILSFLGVNIFQNIGKAILNIAVRILSAIGSYTGLFINSTADVVGDTAKGGVDIAEGTIHSIGNLLQNEDNINGDTNTQMQWNMSMFNLNPAPKPEVVVKAPKPVAVAKNLDDEINNGGSKTTKYAPSDSSSGNKWCPIGFANGSGKCIQTTSDEKCMYGKVFDTQTECEGDIDDTPFKGYASQEREINWGRPPPPPPAGALTPSYQPQMFNELPGQSCNRKPQYCSVGNSIRPNTNRPFLPAQPVYPNNSTASRNTVPYHPQSNYSNQPLPVDSNNSAPTQPNNGNGNNNTNKGNMNNGMNSGNNMNNNNTNSGNMNNGSNNGSNNVNNYTQTPSEQSNSPVGSSSQSPVGSSSYSPVGSSSHSPVGSSSYSPVGSSSYSPVGSSSYSPVGSSSYSPASSSSSIMATSIDKLTDQVEILSNDISTLDIPTAPVAPTVPVVPTPRVVAPVVPTLPVVAPVVAPVVPTLPVVAPVVPTPPVVAPVVPTPPVVAPTLPVVAPVVPTPPVVAPTPPVVPPTDAERAAERAVEQARQAMRRWGF